MEEKVFAPKEVVFREGDFGNSFFQILEGTAGVYLNYGEAEERKLTEMKAGQTFGEMAVIDAWPRSSTVVAEDTLKVTEIPEEKLNEYFMEQPDKILSIMKQIGGRIRTLTEEYDEVAAFLREKKSAEPRSSGFLAKLKKYQSVVASSRKSQGRYSEEDLNKMRDFGAMDKTPMAVAQYRKGTIIFREGEIGSFMYAVHAGSVGIYTNYDNDLRNKLTTLYTNSFFGEMSLVDQEKRSATAVAEEDGTTVEIIRAEELEDMFKSNPVKVDMILRHLTGRLRRLTKDYVKACEEAVADA